MKDIHIQKIIFLVIFVFSFSSCITHKNLEYLSTDKKIVKSINYDYIVEKEDLLSVQISSNTNSNYDFFNLQETSNPQLLSNNPYLYGYLVKSDGKIILPMIGEVMVKGFTLSEVESLIVQIASSYISDPIVKVNILNFKVSILGEVNSPGEYNIVRSNQTLLHLIGKANDLTEFANRKNIKIIRNNRNASSSIIHFDLTDEKVLNRKDFFLQSQDIVYVKPLRKKFYSVKSLSSALSISMSAISMYLILTN